MPSPTLGMIHRPGSEGRGPTFQYTLVPESGASKGGVGRGKLEGNASGGVQPSFPTARGPQIHVEHVASAA